MVFNHTLKNWAAPVNFNSIYDLLIDLAAYDSIKPKTVTIFCQISPFYQFREKQFY